MGLLQNHKSVTDFIDSIEGKRWLTREQSVSQTERISQHKYILEVTEPLSLSASPKRIANILFTNMRRMLIFDLDIEYE